MGLLSGFFVSPEFEYSNGVNHVELYHLPGARLNKAKSDAILLPVNADLWIGGPVGKFVRDASGDIVQDRARMHAPLKTAHAVAVRSGRGSSKHVILFNIYDENKLTNQATMLRGFDAGFRAADEIYAGSVTIPDFTEEFNYFTHRANSTVAAEVVAEAISRNQRQTRTVKIVAFTPEAVQAYIDALRRH